MAYKILVVEDEKAIARVLELKLKQAGFDVDTAEDGKRAKEKIATNSYTIILLDVILPLEDGFSVLSYIRKDQHLTTPVIILTNLGQLEDRKKLEELGITRYYVKSEISIYSLVDEIKKLITQ